MNFGEGIGDIQGSINKISVQSAINNGDYFLGSAGNVGSAISEKGFHYWLANFIGWDLPSVVTFNDNESKLYLECIFPLFFIEQKRGWSEIQANTPTHYGIKGVKKSAAEFCLAIDSFEYEKKIAKLKNTITSAEDEWDKLRSFSESIADFSAVKLNKLSDLDSKKSSYRIGFYYLENNVYISVDEQKKSLNKLIEKLSKDIADKTPNNENLNAQLSIVRTLQRKVEEISNSIGMTNLSISEVKNKLLRLGHDYEQYQQLRQLKNVGSKIESDIDTKTCPICENDLYDSLGHRTAKRETMTLEENIAFLKNQLDFFKSIEKKSLSQFHDLKVQGKLLYSKMEVENEKLSNLKKDLGNINGVTNAILREKIQAEILQSNVSKLKESQDDLNEEVIKIYTVWNKASNSLTKVKENSITTDKGTVIRMLESFIKSNLRAFNFNHSSINLVSISKQTLRPEQDGYDIVVETSASDYIRIIWSYTLALLELAGKKEEIKHGGFVVFDEPRQHEASKISFTNFIEKSSESNIYK